MSDTKSADTSRPWGDRPVASGVEAVFAWAQKEMAALHDKFDGALKTAHARIDELEAKARTPAPQAAPQSPASVGGAAGGADTTKGSAP